MIELPLTDEGRAYGERVKRNYDRSGVKDAFRLRGVDKRWTGHAVEFELDRWLRGEEIPHVWNGGLDDLPDFEFGDVRVACKSNVGDSAREDFVFTVPERHARKLGDGVLFSIVLLREKRVWIAGYISAREFRRESQKHRKGDPGFVPGRPFESECRTISAAALQPADLFFGLLRVAA